VLGDDHSINRAPRLASRSAFCSHGPGLFSGLLCSGPPDFSAHLIVTQRPIIWDIDEKERVLTC